MASRCLQSLRVYDPPLLIRVLYDRARIYNELMGSLELVARQIPNLAGIVSISSHEQSATFPFLFFFGNGLFTTGSHGATRQKRAMVGTVPPVPLCHSSLWCKVGGIGKHFHQVGPPQYWIYPPYCLTYHSPTQMSLCASTGDDWNPILYISTTSLNISHLMPVFRLLQILFWCPLQTTIQQSMKANHMPVTVLDSTHVAFQKWVCIHTTCNIGLPTSLGTAMSAFLLNTTLCGGIETQKLQGQALNSLICLLDFDFPCSLFLNFIVDLLGPALCKRINLF